MKRLLTVLITVCAAMFMFAALAQAKPQGNIYVVTRTDDPAGSGSIGNLSLRQAVAYANADPGSTIQLTHNAVYVLSNTGLGELSVTADMTFTHDNNLSCLFVPCPAVIQGQPGVWNTRLIEVGASAHVALENLTLQYGKTDSGGAIYNGGYLTLDYSTLYSNTATTLVGSGYGGGLANHGTAILNASDLTYNSADYGGGLYNDTGAVVTGDSSRFLNNVAGYAGGAIDSYGTISLTNSTLDSNQAPYGWYGGMANEQNASAWLFNTSVTNNAANGGGGLYNAGAFTLISDTVQFNTASTAGGGGIYVSSGRVTLINSQVSNNAATGSTQDGGGIMIKTVGGTVYMTLTNTAVTTNTVSYEGGGIAVWPDFTSGGNTYLTISGGSISGNTAHQGGGGMEYNPNFCSVPCANLLTISGTQILSNTANSSGSGGLDLSSGAYPVTIVNSVIDYNQTSLFGFGGGIDSNGSLSIVNTDISNNYAGTAGGGYYNSGGTVSIRDSTINNNRVHGTNNNMSTGGGGVYNYGTLTLDNVHIAGNVASYGGAGGLLNRSGATINNSSIASNAAVTLTGGLINTGSMALNDTTVNNNTAAYDAGVRNLGSLTINGGAIRDNSATGSSAGLDNLGTLNTTGLSIFNNQDLTGYGGGLDNGGTAWLTDTQIISNAAPLGWGAGLMSMGPTAHMTLSHVTVLSNTATAATGIYNNEGTLTVTASTIAHNVATGGPGGGILNATYNWGPGWGVGSLRMDKSTVFDNSTSDNGGGIYNSHVMTITNSTISGNRAATSGGGIFSEPGYNLNPNAYLNNVTIANNEADSNNDGVGQGGGVAIVSSTLSIRNTLIGANTDLSSQAPDCSGTLASDRYNLVQNMTSCTLSGNLIGNVTGKNPDLGPLQNNGGATWTQALLSGSPAIDAGNPTTPGSGLAACMPIDQRGLPRPANGRCDIGAFEYGAAFKVYLSLVRR